MNNRKQSEKVQLLLEAVKFYQGMVLDAVEDALGNSPSWPELRSRVLRALGDRGLAKSIRSIFESSPDQGGAQ